MLAAALISVLLAAIPPLTDSQRVRLETAYDGRDHQEEAFAALLEHVRSWTPGPGDAPVRLQVDSPDLVAAPDHWRGELFRVQGVIQQVTPLEGPWGGAQEWFVRDAQGGPLLVYVADPPEHMQPGARVSLEARFYKRVDAVARDGATRSYAAFVGANPRRHAPASPDALSVLPVLAPIIAGLGAVLLALLLLVRRQRRTAATLRRGQWADAPQPVDDGAALPDDPIEALAELKRRVAEH